MSRTRAVAVTTALGAVVWIGANVLPSAAQEPPPPPIASEFLQASAGHVSCGDTITTDTTLDGDLLDCPSNGIVIGADDITLDLNGHTVSGDGEPFKACPEREFCDVGVLNNGHDGVTVRNGSVGQFESGVLIGRARESRVLDISSSQNTFFGFVVFRSAQILVRGSSGSRNIAPDGDGMGLFESHDVRIVNNEIRRNPGPGIHVQASTDNLIKGNLISHSAPGSCSKKGGPGGPQPGTTQPLRWKRSRRPSRPWQPKRDRPQPPLARRRRHRDRERTRQSGCTQRHSRRSKERHLPRTQRPSDRRRRQRRSPKCGHEERQGRVPCQKHGPPQPPQRQSRKTVGRRRLRRREPLDETSRELGRGQSRSRHRGRRRCQRRRRKPGQRERRSAPVREYEMPIAAASAIATDDQQKRHLAAHPSGA